MMPNKVSERIRQKAYFAKVLALLGGAATVRLGAQESRVSRRMGILRTAAAKTTEPPEKPLQALF